jgi:hypothetical protein
MVLSIFQTLPFRLAKARSDFNWDYSDLHENAMIKSIKRLAGLFIVLRLGLGLERYILLQSDRLKIY